MPFDSLGVYTPATGATTAVSGDIIYSATWNAIHTDFSSALTVLWQQMCLRGYLSGLVLSTAGASATFGIATGVAIDSTSAGILKLTSAYTKTTSAWALGTAAGSLDTGAIANSTWYHVFLIQRVDTGVVDVLISLSATAPTMPGSYTLFRRIGSMKINGSAQWTLFSQEGDEFLWDVNVLDVAAGTGDTTAHSATLTVPTGVKVCAQIGVVGDAGAAGDGRFVISSLDQSDQAASSTTINVGFSQTAAATGQSASVMRVRTNTSAQIRYRAASANGTVIINTSGWIDDRGKL